MARAGGGGEVQGCVWLHSSHQERISIKRGGAGLVINSHEYNGVDRGTFTAPLAAVHTGSRMQASIQCGCARDEELRRGVTQRYQQHYPLIPEFPDPNELIRNILLFS